MFFKLALSFLLLVTCSHSQRNNASSSSNPQLSEHNAQPSGKKAPSLREIESQIVHLVNDYRRSKGRTPLKPNPAMQQEAARHSQNMARGRIPLSHRGFEDRILRIREKTGVKGRSGENVAEGYKTAREAVDAWIKSPGHRRHMLGDFDLTGVGVARDRNGKLYFTQVFIAL